MDSSRAWIQLHGGTPADLLTLTESQVVVPDLIRSICRLPRYLGHTLGSYAWTVGQHSLLVADILEQWGAPHAVVREGLLHDLPEGVYGDMPTPVRIALEELGGGDAWRALRHGVDVAVRTALGLAIEEHPLVRRADLAALAIERQHLMAPCERDWGLTEPAPPWPRLEPARDVTALATLFETRLTQITDLTSGVPPECEGHGHAPTPDDRASSRRLTDPEWESWTIERAFELVRDLTRERDGARADLALALDQLRTKEPVHERSSTKAPPPDCKPSDVDAGPSRQAVRS